MKCWNKMKQNWCGTSSICLKEMFSLCSSSRNCGTENQIQLVLVDSGYYGSFSTVAVIQHWSSQACISQMSVCICYHFPTWQHSFHFVIRCIYYSLGVVLPVAIPARFVASFIHHFSLFLNNNKCTEKAAFLINLMIFSMLFFFYDGS